MLRLAQDFRTGCGMTNNALGFLKHTPGPWAVKGVGEVIVRASGKTLCDVYSSSDEQSDVDAHVIAAAPDLLEAAEAALLLLRFAAGPHEAGMVTTMLADAINKAKPLNKGKS